MMSEPKHVAFSGSGKVEPTEAQLYWLFEELLTLQRAGYGVLHHGDCINADEAAHRLAHELGYIVVVHPPTDPKARAWCTGDLLRVEKPYLVRNHDLVNESDRLLALPSGPERLRSGTWATIRYARKIGKPVSMRLP